MTDPERIDRYRQRVEQALDRHLPSPDDGPERLHEAMRYAVLGAGKRVRPLLVYFAGEALGVDPASLDGPAAAVELIHAYSLVHDDLPAMDDDDLRRGRPTCHKAFDEATAILVGDALQVLAFRILATDAAMVANPELRLAMIRTLADASGTAGMAGGQALDLAAEGRELGVPELEQMHGQKTGALIQACILMAAHSAPDLGPDQVSELADYGRAIGLAFQIRDDVLDVAGDAEELGKATGADLARNKPTYPAALGLDGAMSRARELKARALAAIQWLGPQGEPLRWMADYIVERKH